MSLAFQTLDPGQRMDQLYSLSDQSQESRLLDKAVFAKHVGLPGSLIGGNGSFLDGGYEPDRHDEEDYQSKSDQDADHNGAA
jgi:hypothetical protein